VSLPFLCVSTSLPPFLFFFFFSTLPFFCDGPAFSSFLFPSRLLFHRVRPVFVFDGTTPALKRSTQISRRRRKEAQQGVMRKTAEKLLMNQLKKQVRCRYWVGVRVGVAMEVSREGVRVFRVLRACRCGWASAWLPAPIHALPLGGRSFLLWMDARSSLRRVKRPCSHKGCGECVCAATWACGSSGLSSCDSHHFHSTRAAV